MITLRWSPFPEADIASYNVYRSIIGFRSTKVPLATVDGKTLELKVNGGSTQVFTFDAVTEIIDIINATIVGGQAFESADTLSFFVRSDLREAPGSVEVVGGTAIGDFGQAPRLITEKSEFELLTNVLALLDPTEVVEFIDQDGVLLDFYAITTVSSLGDESAFSPAKQPIESTGNLCILEGIVIDAQGVRIPDAEVQVTLLVPPEPGEAGTSAISNISTKPITTLTEPDGRFCIAVLQNSLVEVQIPQIGFTHNIRVPEKSFAFVNDLIEDTDYRYPLGHLGPS